MPFVQGVGDVMTQPLYDELTVAAAGTSQLVYFSQPVGQAGKTLLNTNMQLAGQLQAGYRMMALALAVSFRTAALLANLKLILDTGFGQLNIAAKWWWQSPLRFLPGGLGILGFSDLGAATPLNAAWSHGTPDPRAIYTLRQPIEITQTESFNFTTVWATAVTPSADTPMTVALHGELTRTVQ
jgi:hypothetical protein